MSRPNKPKLLVLTSTFPRWSDDSIPGFVAELSFGLAKYFEVTVLAPHCQGANVEETLTHGPLSVAVHRFRYAPGALETLAYGSGMLAQLIEKRWRLLLLPFFMAAQIISIRRLHKKEGFDLMQAHWILPQGLLAALFSSITPNAPPLLVTAHGGDLFAMRGPMMARLKRWTLNRAACVCVVSQAMRRQCRTLGCDRDDVVVAPMGVDFESCFVPPASPSARQGLIFVGRLVEKKGLRFLIAALGELIETRPELELCIIGAGPEAEAAKQLADSAQVAGHVRFLGALPREHIAQHLREAAILVMPSVVAGTGDEEGLGLVALEALGCGCAVVASDLPAIRDVIVDGETGLLARVGDSKDLATKIRHLLDEPEQAQRLAREGRRRAQKHYGWPIATERYARLLGGLLSGRDSGA